jgi:4-amino-4-deoxy-L-arabinose transferase-like glycosyltransferase
MTTPIVEASAWRRSAFIVPPVFVAALLVHVFVLQRFANSGDEYAYVWQATAFSEGHVTALSPQPAEAFKQNHLGDADGRRFSKYPPGWPLMLALGTRAGLPGLVNPLLAALALAGIYRLACSWVGGRAAACGALVVGSSPFFLLNAGSYHSHPSCLFALTGLALSLAWAHERPGARPLFLAGLCFGLAVLIRPYTALLIGLPLIIGLGVPIIRHLSAARRSAWSAGVWFALGGMPWIAVLLIVNDAATGSWWTLAWTRFDATEELGFGSYGHTLYRGLKNAVRLCLEGVVYTSFIALPLLAAALGQSVAHRRLLWVLLAAPVVGYVFWWSVGGNRYGPRFYFEALLPLTLLVGAGFDRLRRTRRATAIIAVVAIATIASSGVLGYRAHAQVQARRDVYRVVEHAGIRQAVVLLKTASADMVRLDLNRNPPDFRQASVLYAMARTGRDYEVAEAHPERTLYYYEWREDGGRLWPVPPDQQRRGAPAPITPDPHP